MGLVYGSASGLINDKIKPRFRLRVRVQCDCMRVCVYLSGYEAGAGAH